MEMIKIAPNFAVQDIEKTVTFYRDVLGFKLEMAVSEDKSGVEQEFYIKDCNGYILGFAERK